MKEDSFVRFSLDNRVPIPQRCPVSTGLPRNYFLRICSTMLSCPGTQRPTQSRSHGVWLLIELLADLCIIHMVLVHRHIECKSLGSWRPPSDLNGKLGRPGKCDRVRVSEGSSEKVMCDGVRVKPSCNGDPRILELPGMRTFAQGSCRQ
jgi:hypothetical protein